MSTSRAPYHVGTLWCQADLILAPGISTMDHDLYWKQLFFSPVITGALTCYPENCRGRNVLFSIAPQNSEATPRMLWLGGMLAWTSLHVLSLMGKPCASILGRVEEWRPLEDLESWKQSKKQMQILP